MTDQPDASDVRRAERRRIAAEIHDDTIQSMVAASLSLARLARKYPDAEVAEIDVRVRAAIRRLRHMVFELEPDTTGLSLAKAIRQYLEVAIREHADSHEIQITIVDELIEMPRDAAVSVIFRNCREAALNAIRHGNATELDVTISLVNDCVVTHIVDNGDGCEVTPSLGAGHAGLVHMRRRAIDEGGSLHIASVPGVGTALRFSVRASHRDNLGANPEASYAPVSAHSFGVRVA